MNPEHYLMEAARPDDRAHLGERRVAFLRKLANDPRDWVPLVRRASVLLVDEGLIERDVSAGLARITEKGHRVLAGEFQNR